MYYKMSVHSTNIPEGDFTSLKLGDGELEMLQDAYQAVTQANRWGYLRRDDVPGAKVCAHCNGNDCKGRYMPQVDANCFCAGHCRICQGKGVLKQGFMFSDAPELRDIDLHMKYDGHSGASYGWTMRNMEHIAKNGWDSYVKLKGVKPPPVPPIIAAAQAVDNFIHSIPPTSDLTAFANAIQKDAGMRATIPDIDTQADALRKFASGGMSYAEMRSLCG
jgi:hypothetical protein